MSNKNRKQVMFEDWQIGFLTEQAKKDKISASALIRRMLCFYVLSFKNKRYLPTYFRDYDFKARQVIYLKGRGR